MRLQCQLDRENKSVDSVVQFCAGFACGEASEKISEPQLTCEDVSTVWCDVGRLLQLDGHCTRGWISPCHCKRLAGGDLKRCLTRRDIDIVASQDEGGVESQSQGRPGAHFGGFAKICLLR